jgi:hypothetical protein
VQKYKICSFETASLAEDISPELSPRLDVAAATAGCGTKRGAKRSRQAPEGRKNVAHGASRGGRNSSKTLQAPEGRKNLSLWRFCIATPCVIQGKMVPRRYNLVVISFAPYGAGVAWGRLSHGLRHGLRSSARFAGWVDMRSISSRRCWKAIVN